LDIRQHTADRNSSTFTTSSYQHHVSSSHIHWSHEPRRNSAGGAPSSQLQPAARPATTDQTLKGPPLQQIAPPTTQNGRSAQHLHAEETT